MEPHDACTPETLFDRHWALTVLDRVMGEVRAEFRKRGKEEVFERLKVNLIGEENPFYYRETASKPGMSEAALRVAVHRLRRRFGELLRAEIAQTVTTDEEVEDEIRYLIHALKA